MNFEELANEHKDTVYRQLIRVCGNHEDAEDVLVEALLRAYRHLDQLRDSVAFRAWLAQIARRVCWQLKERDALLPLVQLSTLEEEGRQIAGAAATPDADFASREMKALLSGAIAQLPEQYREVYQMRDVEEMSGSEVSERLGISQSAMKSRLLRARDMVRQHLDAALLKQSKS